VRISQVPIIDRLLDLLGMRSADKLAALLAHHGGQFSALAAEANRAEVEVRSPLRAVLVCHAEQGVAAIAFQEILGIVADFRAIVGRAAKLEIVGT